VKVYYFDGPVTVPGKEAQVIGATLDELRARQGVLRPRDVVEAARPADSPLNRLFEWDDRRAAEEYRVVRAREIIRSVKVRWTEQGSGKELDSRAFVSLRPAGWTGAEDYRDVVQVMGDQDLRAALLAIALKEADSWRSRYAELAELAAVFQAIERAKRRRGRRRAG